MATSHVTGLMGKMLRKCWDSEFDWNVFPDNIYKVRFSLFSTGIKELRAGNRGKQKLTFNLSIGTVTAKYPVLIVLYRLH